MNAIKLFSVAKSKGKEVYPPAPSNRATDLFSSQLNWTMYQRFQNRHSSLSRSLKIYAGFTAADVRWRRESFQTEFNVISSSTIRRPVHYIEDLCTPFKISSQTSSGIVPNNSVSQAVLRYSS